MSRQTIEQIAGGFFFKKCFRGLSFKEYWQVITNNVTLLKKMKRNNSLKTS